MTGDFLVVGLGDRPLGIPAMRVRKVVRLPAVTRVPGAPAMIAGVMNLRGQLITAIDMRARLGLPPASHGLAPMAIITEHSHHLYALVVDSVGDVVRSRPERQEPPPSTLTATWRQAALFVQRDEALVLVLDVDAILTPPDLARAA